MSAEQRAKVFKALSDPRRIDIVDALAKYGPLCGTELANKLGMSLALVSHHWDVLVEAGLIRKKRVGQARYCTLDPAKLHDAVGEWDGAVLVEPADAPEARDVPREIPKEPSRTVPAMKKRATRVRSAKRR